MPEHLIQITDAAIASSYERAGRGSGLAQGEWMACRPGCHQCCIGVFPVSALDARRLREALAAAPIDVRKGIEVRAAASRSRLEPGFPGDASTGQLFTEAQHEEAFEDFANDEPCPVLDPLTGTCELYAARPVPCRTFGPPMPVEDGYAVCELCFVGAPPEEVNRCAVDAGFLREEEHASRRHAEATGEPNPTLIAFALSSAP